MIGGKGKDIVEIKEKFQKENILILGHRPYKEIPLYLKASDVLVLPNKRGDRASEEYTSPMKMFEYMASGVPIVASNLPSIKEVLNKENAILVEPNNPESLAEGIKKILQNKNLADKISRWALRDVQNHTWQKRVEKIINFIKK